MTTLHALEVGVLVGAVGYVAVKAAVKYVASKGWAAVVAKVKADLAA